MEIDLALMADAATVDASGKLNILGVFDRITASRFPAQHGRIALVLRFSAGVQEAGEHQLDIRLLSPSGEEMLGVSGAMQLGPGSGSSGTGIRVPHVLNFDGIVFGEAGAHTFEIRVDGEHHVSLPLLVAGVGAGAGPGSGSGSTGGGGSGMAEA